MVKQTFMEYEVLTETVSAAHAPVFSTKGERHCDDYSPSIEDKNIRSSEPPRAVGDSTLLTSKCHPRVREVRNEVDGLYLSNWMFRGEKARQKFVAADFSGVTCLYFPEALDGRIAYASRLLTILFLVDDILDDMSFDDGKALNERLMTMCRGQGEPDRSDPREWMMFDLWNDMRKCDPILADHVLEPTFLFMRAQTDENRTKFRSLGDYLSYREADVGKKLLSALMSFSMSLDIASQKIDLVEALESNAARHISAVNDIFSFEKEKAAAEAGHNEGSALCSAVSVLSSEASINNSAAKAALWIMVRDWEGTHVKLAKQISALVSRELSRYVEGLEYQMSGNEVWSASTPRYHHAA